MLFTVSEILRSFGGRIKNDVTGYYNDRTDTECAEDKTRISGQATETAKASYSERFSIQFVHPISQNAVKKEM